MSVLYRVYRCFSPKMRHRLKRWVGGLGHHASLLDTLKANKDAIGKRRLDEAFCHFLQTYSRLQNKSLAGLRCLDFGAGYVATDSLVMWLLGASRVDTVDYNAIAQPAALRKAVAAMDEERLLGCAKKYGFVDLKDFKERLAILKAMVDEGNLQLDQLSIYYRAPFDATNRAQVDELQTVDLIWSTSVLEHIHPNYLEPILVNLGRLLTPWGVMVHLIDARDHLDLENAPFGFFDEDADYVLDRDFDARGNRLLPEEWAQVAGSIKQDAKVLGLDKNFENVSSAAQRAHFYLLTAKHKASDHVHIAHH